MNATPVYQLCSVILDRQIDTYIKMKSADSAFELKQFEEIDIQKHRFSQSGLL